MAAVPRNEPCPCGSGKKYKHCCGKKEAVSIASLIDRELIECMNDMRQFVLQRYEREVEDLLNQFPLDEMPEEIELGVQIMAVNWMLFCWPLDQTGQTIFSAYRKSRHWERWRSSVQAHIERWEGAVPSFHEFIGYDDGNRPVVRDLLTGKEQNIHLLASYQWPNVIEKGDVVFGFLVPYQEAFTYFTTVLPFPASGKERLLRAIQKEAEWSGQPAASWMRDRFVAVFSDVLLEWLWQFAKQFKWDDPKQADVIRELDENEPEAPAALLSQAFAIWALYCGKTSRLPYSVPVYAAALRHVAGHLMKAEGSDVEDIADRYDVMPQDVRAAALDFFLMAVDDEDEEWLDDWDEDWFEENRDELDARIDEWLDEVDFVLAREGWDEKRVNRHIDRAIRSWRKEGLLEGVNEKELREELRDLAWEMFTDRGFI
ncbi:SEC-C domain-containing protein [Geobacillus jurassicus]|uniref:SEC-C domain-containing protein n=1 Tax=Geobacillus jurassicus TaxID=235932 RepID=A0ABV6GS37_9BACL|nr:SEC-C domain-containing protein [Geobacillus jurassicus]